MGFKDGLAGDDWAGWKLLSLSLVSEIELVGDDLRRLGCNGAASERRDPGQFHRRARGGTGTGHLETGAACCGERVEKYNQLLRIEEALGEAAVYAGRKAVVR